MNQFLRFGKSVTIIIAHNNLKIGDMAVYYKVFLKISDNINVTFKV